MWYCFFNMISIWYFELITELGEMVFLARASMFSLQYPGTLVRIVIFSCLQCILTIFAWRCWLVAVRIIVSSESIECLEPLWLMLPLMIYRFYHGQCSEEPFQLVSPSLPLQDNICWPWKSLFQSGRNTLMN